LKKEIKKRRMGNYFSDVLQLLSGNTLTQLIRILISPIISRIYSPLTFGLMQNFSAITNTLSAIFALRYEPTVVLPKDDDKAAVQLIISLMSIVIFSTVTTPILIIYKTPISNLLNSKDIANFLWLAPILAAFVAYINTSKYWYTRKRKFKRISRIQVMNQLISEGSTLGLGIFASPNVVSMILGRLLGNSISFLTLGVFYFYEDKRIIFDNFRWAEIYQGIKRYKNYPLFDIWGSFLQYLLLYLPGLMLSGYFSPEIAGYYSFANNILRMPNQIISNSIGSVFFERGVKAKYDKRLHELVLMTVQILVAIGFVPFLVVSIYGRDLFTSIFGANWGEAGFYSQLLSLWAFNQFVTSPLGYLTYILEKNRLRLIYFFVNLFLRSGSFIIGGYFQNPTIGIILLGATSVMSSSIFTYRLMHLSGVRLKDIGRIVGNVVIYSTPFIFILFFSKNLLSVNFSKVDRFFSLFQTLNLSRYHFFTFNLITVVILANWIWQYLFNKSFHKCFHGVIKK